MVGIIPKQVRSKVNKELGQLLKGRQAQIPMEQIIKILQKYGIDVLEKGSRELWRGWLVGDEGTVDFDLEYGGDVVGNYLVLGWYRYDDGKFDVYAYVS